MESVSNEKMTAQMTGKDGFIAALDHEASTAGEAAAVVEAISEEVQTAGA